MYVDDAMWAHQKLEDRFELNHLLKTFFILVFGRIDTVESHFGDENQFMNDRASAKGP
jgi:hypothetical protein